MAAGRKPIAPSSGTIRASSARLGIVWMALATASAGPWSDRIRVAAIARGRLSEIPMASAVRDSRRCRLR